MQITGKQLQRCVDVLQRRIESGVPRQRRDSGRTEPMADEIFRRLDDCIQFFPALIVIVCSDQ